jgi:hypothetical protein
VAVYTHLVCLQALGNPLQTTREQAWFWFTRVPSDTHAYNMSQEEWHLYIRRVYVNIIFVKGIGEIL